MALSYMLEQAKFARQQAIKKLQEEKTKTSSKRPKFSDDTVSKIRQESKEWAYAQLDGRVLDAMVSKKSSKHPYSFAGVILEEHRTWIEIIQGPYLYELRKTHPFVLQHESVRLTRDREILVTYHKYWELVYAINNQFTDNLTKKHKKLAREVASTRHPVVDNSTINYYAAHSSIPYKVILETIKESGL